jgi:hypothetical protein
MRSVADLDPGRVPGLMRRSPWLALATLAALLLPVSARAHTTSLQDGGFRAGFHHPLTGVEMGIALAGLALGLGPWPAIPSQACLGLRAGGARGSPCCELSTPAPWPTEPISIF